MNAETLRGLSVAERATLINSQPKVISANTDLEKAEAISSYINSFLDDYFDLCIEEDENKENGSLLSKENQTKAMHVEIDAFLPLAVKALEKSEPDRDRLIASGKNLYEISGAVKLSFANKATRNLSTTMGLLWERLANISPYSINPESEFGVKIKGIDLISRNIHTDVIEYQQLKTQHNTLTGSQKQRSVEELSIHQNPVFCACFSTNGSWTFNHPNIPRVSGREFWSRIGINYDEVLLPVAREFITKVETEYVRILSAI
jgi:hypothetical protein